MEPNLIDRDAVARKAIFPFEELPYELRLRVYDFLGLVHPNYLSIHDILVCPEIIHKVPKVLAKEMLDVYISKNRFSINCFLGLPQLLAAAGDATISKIRRLRLVPGGWATGTSSVVADFGLEETECPLQVYRLTYEMNVDLLRDEPWFKISFIHDDCAGHGVQDHMFFAMSKFLQDTLPNDSNGTGSFDTRSLEGFIDHWMRIKRVFGDAYWNVVVWI